MYGEVSKQVIVTNGRSVQVYDFVQGLLWHVYRQSPERGIGDKVWSTSFDISLAGTNHFFRLLMNRYGLSNDVGAVLQQALHLGRAEHICLDNTVIEVSAPSPLLIPHEAYSVAR